MPNRKSKKKSKRKSRRNKSRRVRNTRRKSYRMSKRKSKKKSRRKRKSRSRRKSRRNYRTVQEDYEHAEKVAKELEKRYTHTHPIFKKSQIDRKEGWQMRRAQRAGWGGTVDEKGVSILASESVPPAFRKIFEQRE